MTMTKQQRQQHPSVFYPNLHPFIHPSIAAILLFIIITLLFTSDSSLFIDALLFVFAPIATTLRQLPTQTSQQPPWAAFQKAISASFSCVFLLLCSSEQSCVLFITYLLTASPAEPPNNRSGTLLRLVYVLSVFSINTHAFLQPFSSSSLPQHIQILFQRILTTHSPLNLYIITTF